MNSIRRSLIPLALLASSAVAQTVSIHPESITVGQPFFVSVQGVFATPCSLDGDSFETQFDGETLDLTLIVDTSTTCIQVLTRLDQSFGTFRLDSSMVSGGQTIEVVFNTNSGGLISEIGRSQTTIRNPGDAGALALQPGFYWDPLYNGSGIAFEVHGSALFLGLFSYDADGQNTWHIALGEWVDGFFEGALQAFSGGACLVCFNDLSEPQPIAIEDTIQVAITGSQAAFVGFGSEAGRALNLRPVSLRFVDSEGTIAGVTFRMPDLSGRWLFTDTDAGALHRVTELRQISSGISDSGLAFFGSEDRSVTLGCGMTAAPARFSCQLIIDNELIGTVDSNDVGHNHIRGEEFLGIRLN